MRKEERIAKEISEKIGGASNVSSVSHCMTRLRLQLKDESKADLPGLKSLDGVMGVIEDVTLQIIIGPGLVNKVAEEMSKLTGLQVGEVDEGDDLGGQIRQDLKAKNNTPFKNFLRKIGNIFIPLIPALVASGIINGIANFFINADKGADLAIMKMLLFMGGGIFTYLGVLVGWNTAKEFGGTPALGAVAGIFVFNPALANIELFGEALVPGRGGLFAVIFAAWLMVKTERTLRRFVPNAIDIILTPLISVLFVGFMTLLVIQPLGGYLTSGITNGIDAILGIGGAFAGAVLAGTFLPLVMVGLHHGLTPIHMQLIQDTGITTLLPVLAMAGAGQVGASMAIYVKTKSKKLKNVIKGALPVGFLGIGEPLLYGVTLPLGRPFITACLGGAAGGAFQAFAQTGAKAVGVSGLTLLPLINGKFAFYFFGLVIAYIFGFIFTYLFGYKEEMAENIK